ncbi:hypothetical protein GALMADRAFT_241829 [Galerina marginata CBS 339.88]|uniref:Chitin synthase export chaperone n=1 Tax=Galerina marginata (strain CBS 339.88) TaxID=685588 RepID=A0A067TG49_GALM3|nr:hypothetical protein GALMADRAFT_241829 [Galerina marginata CBS 339.88]
MSPLYHSKIVFILVSLISLCDAQFVSRRRSPVGRIIGGCIAAAFFLALLLCFLLMMRRRRARMMVGAPQNNQFGGKPLFGGPWGRSNGPTGYGAQGGGHPTQLGNSNNFNNAGQSQGAYNPEYPPQNAPAPPPPYPDTTTSGQNYGAPSAGQNGYSAPPGPPPAAHTTGEDGNFIGGFRH